MMTKKTSQRRFWRGKKASWRPKKKVLMPAELGVLPTERGRWSDGASGEGKEGVNPSGTGLTRTCRYLNTPRTLSGYGEFNGYAVIPPTPSPHTQQSVPKTSAPWNVAGTSAPWNAQGTSALGNEMGTSAPWNAKGTSALWNATRPTTVQVANDPQGSKPTPNNDPKESQPAPTNPQAINDAKGATPAGTRAGRLLSTS